MPTRAYPASQVVVVMATCNGETYLRQQVESILDGELTPAAIHVGDDCSSDGTIALLRRLAEACTVPIRIKINDRRLGPAGNFLHLLQEVPEDAAYVAFADQDDIWETNKLSLAIASLDGLDHKRPALYCSRQKMVDAEDRFLKLSPDFSRPPSFRNALVQNIVTGCTTVINNEALSLVRRAGVPDVHLHDWWLYLLVSGCDGQIIFDRTAPIHYRQHSRNVTGGPFNHWADLKRRVKKRIDGSSASVFERNVRALTENAHLLSTANRARFLEFEAARRGSLVQRLRVLKHFPVYRQTLVDDFILRLLFVLGRL